MASSIRLNSKFKNHPIFNSLQPKEQATLPRLLFECDPVGVFDARPEKLALEMFPLNRLADALPFVQGVLDGLQQAGIIMLGVHDGVPHGVLIDHEVFIVPGPTRNQAKLMEVRNAICLQSFERDIAEQPNQSSTFYPAAGSQAIRPQTEEAQQYTHSEEHAKPLDDFLEKSDSLDEAGFVNDNATLADLRELVITQSQVDIPAGKIQAWLDACGGVDPKVAYVMLSVEPIKPGGDPAKQFMDAVGGNES